jgi:predicted alpha/beta superfamily hydrolase
MKQIYKLLSFLLILLLCNCAVSAQLTLKVNAIPANTPQNDNDVYVAGSFNGWNPGKDKMTKLSDGTYSITLNIAAGKYEYKFTRGSWAKVEGNNLGTFLPNRIIDYKGSAQTVEHTIFSWEGTSGGVKQHTATTNVRIIEDNFEMPQFNNRKRRIWLYLPTDYLTNTSKRYNVMYMQDGQNLFDEYFAFGKEWEIDETLNKLFDNNGDEGCIIVGIDNGGNNRIAEYTPYTNPKYGGGDGEKYIQFITKTLKPYIDNNYRTKKEREFTGIGGSSLGGLISYYGAIKNQDIFSRALIFSPSFWWNAEIFKLTQEEGKQKPMKIFLMAGGAEEPDDDVVFKTKQMYDELLDSGFSKNEIFFATHSDGTHSEWYWAREFGPAYAWLWTNLVRTESVEHIGDFSFSPNPADDYIRFSIPLTFQEVKIEIRDIKQKLILKQTVRQGDTLSVSHLPKGIYTVEFKDGRQSFRVQKLIVEK